jgi:hypothetical protein
LGTQLITITVPRCSPRSGWVATSRSAPGLRVRNAAAGSWTRETLRPRRAARSAARSREVKGLSGRLGARVGVPAGQVDRLLTTLDPRGQGDIAVDDRDLRVAVGRKGERGRHGLGSCFLARGGWLRSMSVSVGAGTAASQENHPGDGESESPHVLSPHCCWPPCMAVSQAPSAMGCGSRRSGQVNTNPTSASLPSLPGMPRGPTAWTPMAQHRFPQD